MFQQDERVPNQTFRYLFCSAHVFHGHCYNGELTLKLTLFVRTMKSHYCFCY